MNQAYLVVMIYRGNFKRWATTLFSFIRAVTLNVSFELVHQEEEAGFCKNESCQLEFYTSLMLRSRSKINS